jgi:hypothetical protein
MYMIPSPNFYYEGYEIIFLSVCPLYCCRLQIQTTLLSVSVSQVFVKRLVILPCSVGLYPPYLR